MADDLTRLSLTLPTEMADRLDDIVAEWEYDSRSGALRDALRDFFTNYEWEAGGSGRMRGTVAIVYDHHVSDLPSTLVDVQHDHHDTIIAVQHVHLEHDACLETLAVEGPTAEIQSLANALRSHRGVKQVKVTVVDA